MNKRINIPSLLALLLAAMTGSVGIPAFADESEVDINLSVQRFLGSESELRREKFFNMHDNHTAWDYGAGEVEYMQDVLNAGYGRIFYSPLAVQGDGPYPDAAESMVKGAEAIEERNNSRLSPYYSHRMIVTDHPRNVYQPERDPVAGAIWAADYFQYYYDDQTRPLFYEPMNEPFVHAPDYVEGPWNPDENKFHQDGMTAWFKEIGREFDERGLPVNIIGYSAAWPSLELWDFGHWEAFMKAFMDDAGDYVDAFSTHLYDGVNIAGQDNLRSGSNTSAILDLIETYSNIKWNYTKPHAITEYGGIVNRPAGEIFYDPAINSQELRSHNHILFSLLERQDRILTSTPFITGKSRWYYQNNNNQPYSAALWRPDPDKIVGTKVGGFLLTEKVKFFQLWREVRGNRAAIRTDDPDLNAQAFVYGPYAFVALNNLDDVNKAVELDFLNDLENLVDVRIKRLNVPVDEVAIYTDNTVLEAPESLIMAPAETIILQYRFAEPVSQRRAIRSVSYYSGSHLETIVADQALTFNFDSLDLRRGPRSRLYNRIPGGFSFDQAYFSDTREKQKLGGFVKYLLHRVFYRLGYNDSRGHATLRMSIGRKHDKSKQPEVYVNGHRVDVPNDWAGYDQANRDDFFGAIEVPVPIKYLKPDTTVEIVFPDSEGRVSSVILDVEKRERRRTVAVEGIEIASPVFELNKDRNRRLKSQVLPQNATDKYVLWTSSDPSVASVGDDGTITPLQPGNITVTAQTYEGGFVATADVTVLDQLSIPDTVTITEDFSDEVVSASYTVAIAYSASTDRDINLELRAPDNTWLGGTTVTVPPGEGTVNIVLNFPAPLPAGVGYRFAAGIRPVGGTWRDNFDGHAVPGVEIAEAPVP